MAAWRALRLNNPINFKELTKRITARFINLKQTMQDRSKFISLGENLDQKIDTELEEGVVIQSVEDDGSASGKLEAGDIVVKVNDVSISNVAYFRYELFKNEVGDKVTITVERDGKLKDIDITLKAK